MFACTLFVHCLYTICLIVFYYGFFLNRFLLFFQGIKLFNGSLNFLFLNVPAFICRRVPHRVSNDNDDNNNN